jgi:hypothetical protein
MLAMKRIALVKFNRANAHALLDGQDVFRATPTTKVGGKVIHLRAPRRAHAGFVVIEVCIVR